MANSTESILNFVPLSSSVETVKTGIPKILPESFWSTTENVVGDKANYIKYTGTRQVARVVPYGAPPVQTKKMDVSDQSIKLLHTTEKMPFSQELFRVFRAWEKYEPQQMFAKQQIAYQGLQFRQRFDNLRLAAVLQVLANGILYFDVDGNLLPSSSGADLTVDELVPANNKNQLNGIIGASWATAGTDIVTQVNSIKQQAIRLTGFPITTAYYGKNIPGYLSLNTAVSPFLSRNQVRNEQMLSTGLIPDGVLGLKWVPCFESFYADQNDVVRGIFGDDAVTFAPDISAAVYCLFQGSYLVPSSFGMFSDGMQALGSLSEVYGMGRYAYLDVPPTQIHDVAFDTFLPLLRVPNSFFMADVTP